ncbi:CDP-diacylglycerol--glycerol-3-phosphate 3-phosphatidyltransferase, mitochondrial [Diorhabda sublineata]|uniref:CDP-diacylglycerol--glycerol-3-phosphate 3-phosphatidyltransferase, mitochondrial n=1 Tax=Diorhabda sublineata TaxID=1163346 RepID=UPI0024E17E58|nr:CDP-diacylglycerol--glycerol-3-phosphate 3-phosphatidyltransferase, mitochondrial [Diorhabda sublineata]
MIRRLFSVLETTLPSEQISYTHSVIKNENIPFGWLLTVAPCFSVSGKDITILTEPEEFYNTLLTNCSTAKERITLVSLYLGSGNLEQKLLESIRNNKSYRNKKLRINILLDYTRGSRGTSNSRNMILPLIQENTNLKVSLYHTPELRGFLKKIVPDRWNELLGLQHMKIYIFDDTLIISGANLSNDYFTNRQDRYFVIKDKNLTDFYSGLINEVQDFSLHLDKHDNIGLSKNWKQLPYESNKKYFVEKAADKIKYYIQNAMDKNCNCNDNNNSKDTWIYPMVQMGQLDINHDALITNKILADAPPGSKLKIATGYFNLTKDYMNTIIDKCEADCDILMAHPKANGFLGAKGLAGGIPYAYSYIAKNFKKLYEQKNQQHRIRLFEYYRESWTYHSKGLWYYMPNENVPSMTLIGSPNFGERSVKRDLETQVAIVTKNSDLSNRLNQECSRLFELGLKAETERKVPVWVNTFVLFFRSYF